MADRHAEALLRRRRKRLRLGYPLGVEIDVRVKIVDGHRRAPVSLKFRATPEPFKGAQVCKPPLAPRAERRISASSKY